MRSAWQLPVSQSPAALVPVVASHTLCAAQPAAQALAPLHYHAHAPPKRNAPLSDIRDSEVLCMGPALKQE